MSNNILNANCECELIIKHKYFLLYFTRRLCFIRSNLMLILKTLLIYEIFQMQMRKTCWGWWINCPMHIFINRRCNICYYLPRDMFIDHPVHYSGSHACIDKPPPPPWLWPWSSPPPPHSSSYACNNIAEISWQLYVNLMLSNAKAFFCAIYTQV